MLPLAFTSVAVVQMKKFNFFQTDSFETETLIDSELEDRLHHIFLVSPVLVEVLV